MSWSNIVKQKQVGEDVTGYDRETVARQMLEDAIRDNDLQLFVEQAIANIEKTHAVGSPKWQACMRLLEGDTCYEMAKLVSGENDGPHGCVLNDYLYKAGSDEPPHIITHGRDEPEERCWHEWPEEEEEVATAE
jgi:hypothetical protein